MDKSKITDVFVSGIDHKDYPDYVDAYIDSAQYEGRDMTDGELNQINEDHEFVYEKLISQIY